MIPSQESKRVKLGDLEILLRRPGIVVDFPPCFSEGTKSLKSCPIF